MRQISLSGLVNFNSQELKQSGMIGMKVESFAIACNRSLVKIPPRMGGNLIVFVRFVLSLRFPPEWGGI